MKVNILNRIFYSFLLLIIGFLYFYPLEDPRNVTRGLSYAFAGIGILGFFIHLSLKISIERNNFFLRKERLILTALIIIVLIAIVTHFVNITIHFRNSFFLGERDFTSMAEVILNITKGLGFFSPFHGNGNSSYLSHHFSPALAFYTPFFYIFDTRMAMAWGQLFFSILLYVLSLSLIFRDSIVKQIKIDEIAIWCIFITSNIYIYRIMTSYHFEILAAIFFLATIIAHSKKNTIAECILLILTVSVKEDMAIYLSIYYMGETIYSRIKEPKDWQRNFAFFLFTSFCFLVAIPFLRNFFQVPPDENWILIWSEWGSSPQEIIKNLLSSPISPLVRIWEKSSTLWELSLGFGFLFYLSPRYFIYIILISSIHFLSGREWHNSFYNYYIYPLLPVLLYASYEGFRKLKEISFHKNGYKLFFLVLALVFYRGSWDKNFPFAPTSVNEEKVQSIEKLVRSIEESYPSQPIKVAAQFDLGVFLTLDSSLYPISKELDHNPDLILVNSKSGFSPYVDLKTIASWENHWIDSGQYELWKEEGDFHLYKKVTPIL